MKKARRGRPPLSAAEKARRAAERNALKATGKVTKGKRGRPAKTSVSSPKVELSKLDTVSVVTFANHLLSHEKSIHELTANMSNTLTQANAVMAWANKAAPAFNALEAKCLESIDKISATLVALETRLQKLEDIIDFQEPPKPTVRKVKGRKEMEPNGEIPESEPHN